MTKIETLTFTRVHFNWEGDGVLGLYDHFGDLIASGDEYHDDIGQYVNGLIDGIKYTNVSVEMEDLYVDADDFEDECYAPDSLAAAKRRFTLKTQDELE